MNIIPDKGSRCSSCWTNEARPTLTLLKSTGSSTFDGPCGTIMRRFAPPAARARYGRPRAVLHAHDHAGNLDADLGATGRRATRRSQLLDYRGTKPDRPALIFAPWRHAAKRRVSAAGCRCAAPSRDTSAPGAMLSATILARVSSGQWRQGSHPSAGHLRPRKFRSYFRKSATSSITEYSPIASKHHSDPASAESAGRIHRLTISRA
jgi:hypothetical protein